MLSHPQQISEPRGLFHNFELTDSCPVRMSYPSQFNKRPYLSRFKLQKTHFCLRRTAIQRARDVHFFSSNNMF